MAIFPYSSSEVTRNRVYIRLKPARNGSVGDGGLAGKIPPDKGTIKKEEGEKRDSRNGPEP